MKKTLFPLLLLLSFYCFSQSSPAAVDTFKARLNRTTDVEARIDLLRNLGRMTLNAGMVVSDSFGNQMLREAEFSRNRRLMVKALLYNGERYSYYWMNKEYFQKGLDYFNKGLDLARQNKLEPEIAQSYLYLSGIYTKVPDLDKSMGYVNQASAVINTLDNDSLKVVVYNTYGNIYQMKKERILSLRNFLNALRLAESLKNHSLLRSCYAYLSNFYSDLSEHDKAIDYFQLAMKELLLTNVENINYVRVVDLYSMGNLYLQKKNFDMSQYYYDQSISLADSLKYHPLKIPAYNGLINQYLQAKEPHKALDFFNTREDLRNFIIKSGFAYQMDNAYGTIYSELGKYDSAKYYFAKAEPVYERISTPVDKLSFYIQYADFHKKSGNAVMAIEYYSKAKAFAEESGNLDWQRLIAKELDSIYARSGDYKLAYQYNSQYHLFKDSIKKLGDEKDLLQMELEDEEQREMRRVKEEQAKLRERHNIQYMGITIGIAVVFLLMVLMGIFRVSETTIRIMGFFAFILLFEFIILIADGQIHHWTHGEPLPLLGIKIILIAMLLPLHHYLEKKVVSYLASRRLILPSRKSIWNSLVSRKSSLKKTGDLHE